MKVIKKITMGVPFAKKKAYEYEGRKYEADLQDGDIVTIQDAGQIQQGQYGEQHVFTIKTRNGDKAISLNQSSMNNLIDSFGDETSKWVGQNVKVWAIKAMVSGKMQTVVYLSHPQAEMDEDGYFDNPLSDATSGEESQDQQKAADQPEVDDISPEDIPF